MVWLLCEPGVSSILDSPKSETCEQGRSTRSRLWQLSIGVPAGRVLAALCFLERSVALFLKVLIHRGAQHGKQPAAACWALPAAAFHLHMPVSVHQQVGRFQIPVHHGWGKEVQVGHALGGVQQLHSRRNSLDTE